MKKQITVIAAVIICTANLFSQRIDIDKFAFDYKYRDVPQVVLDTTYTTFSVNVTKTKALQNYSNETDGSRIRIEGRNYVESNGSLQITISLEDLMIESSSVEEMIAVEKDKEGKEIRRTYTYKVNVVYTFVAYGNVKDAKGTSLKNYTLAGRDSKLTYSSSVYSKRAEAAEYYDNNKLEIKTKLTDDQINAALAKLNSNLDYDFAYTSENDREYIWTTDSKKHPENTPAQQAAEATKAILMQITSKEIPANVLTDLQPQIDYYISVIAKYPIQDDKFQKKIRFAAYYNLANIYFLTDQFAKAKEYAAKIVENDYDPKDGSKMIDEITQIEARYKKHNISTRHFFVPIEKNI